MIRVHWFPFNVHRRLLRDIGPRGNDPGRNNGDLAGHTNLASADLTRGAHWPSHLTRCAIGAALGCNLGFSENNF